MENPSSAPSALPPLLSPPPLETGFMATSSSSAAAAAAAAAAATHREAIKEEERRKQEQAEGDDLLSAPKRKISSVKRAKAPIAKRLKSPTVSVSPLVPTRSTGIKIMLSPRIISPSTELPNTQQESPISPFISKRSRNGHVILDPRFKIGFLDFRLRQWFADEAFRYISKVEKTFRKLFAEYSSEINVQVVEKAHMVNIDDSNPWADWGRHQNAQQRSPTDELDKYLEEETMDVESDLDILQYWKMHSTTYPILARMASDILAVPASTVASESAFSTGGRVVSDYRSRLKSETIEALIYLQDWLRSEDSTLDNIAENVVVHESDCI